MFDNGKLVLSNGRAQVFRKESYNHCTTGSVEWIVVYTQDNGCQVVAQNCKTRKDAMVWAGIYST